MRFNHEVSHSGKNRGGRVAKKLQTASKRVMDAYHGAKDSLPT